MNLSTQRSNANKGATLKNDRQNGRDLSHAAMKRVPRSWVRGLVSGLLVIATFGLQCAQQGFANTIQVTGNTITGNTITVGTSQRIGDPSPTRPTLPDGGFVIAGNLTTSVPAGDARVRLLEQGPLIHNRGAFTAELEILPGEQTGQLTLTMTMHQRIRDRKTFQQNVLGRELGNVLGALSDVAVPPIAKGGNPVVRIPVSLEIATASAFAASSASLSVNTADTTAQRSPNSGSTNLNSTNSGSTNSGSTNSGSGGPANLQAASPASVRQAIVVPGSGVYPVRVSLRRADSNAEVDAFTTNVTVVDDANERESPTDSRLKIGLIVPIHLEPSFQPDGSTGEPNTAKVIALTEALARRPIPLLSVAATPEAVRTLARQASDPDVNRRSPVLDQLRSSLNGREVIGGTFVLASDQLLDDPALSEERILQSAEGTRVLRESLVPAVPNLGIYETRIPNPIALRELGSTKIVTSANALALLPKTSEFYYPESVKLLSVNGVSTQPILIHTKPEDTKTESNLKTKATTKVGVPINDQTSTAFLVDVALAKRCTEKIANRSAADDNILRAQLFIAELALLRFDIPIDQRSKHGLGIAIPLATASSTLDAVLAGVGADDGMYQPVAVSALFDLPPNGRLHFQRKPRPTALLDPELFAELEAVHTKISGYSSMFNQTSGEALSAETDLLTLLASDRKPPDQVSLLATLRAQANAMLGGLQLVQSKPFTLTARSQTVKLGVLNDTGRPSSAFLELQSDNIEFIGAQIDPDRPRRSRLFISVSLGARVQQIPVRIRTRGPGSFSFIAVLRTPAIPEASNGVAISSRRYTLRSTAVGPLGTIMSIGALIFLALWWIRSIARRHRNEAAASISHYPANDNTFSADQEIS